MVSNIVESRNAKLDIFLWCLTLALLVGGALLGYYYLAQQSILLSTVGYLLIGVAAFAVAARTSKGQAFWGYWRESVQEVRKMVWPTRQETLQTTLAVLTMVFVMGLLLWTADFILLRSVAWLTGHWGA